MNLQVIVVVLSLLVVAVGVATGFFGVLFSYFSDYPFVFFALVSFGVSVAAFFSGQGQYALLALGSGIILLGADFWLPPVSVTCTVPNQGVALGFIEQYPQQAFADDTAFCKIWLDLTHFNPTILTLDFGNMKTITAIQLAMLVAILVMTLIAIFYFPEAWATVVTLLLILAIASVLFDGAPLGQVPITLTFILAYVILAPLFILLGSLITVYAARAIPSGG